MSEVYDTYEELRRAVEHKLRRKLDPFLLEEAYYETCEHGPWDDGDVDAIVKYVSPFLLEESQRQKPEPMIAERKAEIVSQEAYEQYRPQVCKFRNKHFGQETAPFDDMDKAHAWLVEASKEQAHGELLGELCYIVRGVLMKLRVRKASPLEPLWTLVKGIERFTVFASEETDHRILSWILIGEESPVSPFLWKYIPGREFTITVRSGDVSLGFIRALARLLRKLTWEKGKASRQTLDELERAYHLRTMIWVHDTWDERLKYWNKRYPKWEMWYPEKLRAAYDRAMRMHWP